MYRRIIDGFLLKCLNQDQAREAIGEVHERLCGAHQSAIKMRCMLRRVGLYWPTMPDDCVWYRRGCMACQCFGDVQLAPASLLHPIVKPWHF
jgi:hypothetical protein